MKPKNSPVTSPLEQGRADAFLPWSSIRAEGSKGCPDFIQGWFV
jgi:hypothetical protein